MPKRFTQSRFHHHLAALLAGATLLSSWSTASWAQPPETRVLLREAEGAGPATLDPAAMAPLFSSGAPAEVPSRLAAGETSASARELAAWLSANPDHQHIAEARFLHAYMLHLSGQHAEALPLLEAAAAEVPLLSDHALYFAGVSAFELERYEDAIRLALAIPMGSVYGPRSQFLRGRALRRTGQTADAVRVLQAFVNAYPAAFYIAAAELELGRALIDVGELDRAADILHRVSVRYPDSSEESAARDLLDSLRPRLSEAARERTSRMSDEDLLARAGSLFERHRSEQVIDLLQDQLERLDVDSTLGCQAAFLVGKSYSKLRRHADAVPFYQAIIASACADEDLRVKSLYTAGQALWNVDRDAESIAHFRQLYTEHPHHTYADDAMLYEARIERSNENETRFLQVLEEQVRRFPEGDMLGDANWLLFEHELSSGRYAQSVSFAAALGTRTGENNLYNRGRIAYFAARSLEHLGERASAQDAYAAVVADFPLSYYALLAMNRLQDLDPERSRELTTRLRATGGAAGGESIPVEPAQIADDPAFQRGLLLVRLGLLELANKQFDRLIDSYPNEDNLLWLVSFLFDRVGAYHLSHDIPRRRISTFLTAYPTIADREHWLIAYPTPFRQEVLAETASRGLDPFLVHAIMREESGFNPRAESWANARGLMQLMTGTAEDMARRTGMGSVQARDLFRPSVSIALGAEYLETLSDRYDGHPMLTIAGYNGGAGNVDRFIRENGHLPMDQFVEEIPYSQTRDYAKRVLMTYWIYHWLYDDDAPLPHIDFTPRTGR